MTSIFICIIKLYQYCISPFIGNCCRFYPNCSEYSLQAVKRYGILKGMLLSVKRILRCNRWCEGGFDPLP